MYAYRGIPVVESRIEQPDDSRDPSRRLHYELSKTIHNSVQLCCQHRNHNHWMLSIVRVLALTSLRSLNGTNEAQQCLYIQTA